MHRNLPISGRGPGASRRGAAGHSRGRWLSLAITATFVVSLAATSGAQAVVVSDAGNNFGVALVPGTSANLATAGISTVTSVGPCTDPALSSDLFLPNYGICSHGGAVMHNNETFALTWDPARRYWSTTRNYLELFLSDVANGSGTLTSPYAVTSQYTDTNGAFRAANASAYGGGCIDYGAIGGSACQFGSSNPTAPGSDYPTSFCPVTGNNQFHETLSGSFDTAGNDHCVTDAQIKVELQTILPNTVLGHTKPGYTPLIVLLTPPGVVTCLDTAGNLCSANGVSTAQFCSYHSQVNVGGTEVTYVVQPWTASWSSPLGCDDPSFGPIPSSVPPDTLAVAVGQRLVSPLSQGQVAAIVNPGMVDGWFRNSNGAEINDNGCVPFGSGLDSVTVGSSPQNPYFLQREFNNAGVIESDPNALACTPGVALLPTFVVPSAVNPGDVVEFDGSTTVSSLIVPRAKYAWTFGDGTAATGPSVVHSYASGASYNVSLTVTDRGGYVRSLTQTIDVLGANGQPVPPGAPGTPPAKTGSGGSHPSSAFQVRIQLMPQGLRAMLRDGVSIHVRSNERANGFVTVLISRNTAKRAHINPGRGATVAIGRGTYSGIKNGTVFLHLHLSKNAARKLGHLSRLTLTVRLALFSINRDHLAIVAAASY